METRAEVAWKAGEPLTIADAPFDKVCYIGCGVTTGVGAVIYTARWRRARTWWCSGWAASG